MSYPDEYNMTVSQMYRKQCLQSIGILVHRTEYMKKLIQQMNKEDINYLLLKGYVIKDFYLILKLRSFGDIDFLVCLEDRQKSDELMMREGFECKMDWEVVFNYLKGLEYYEIHTDVMEGDFSDKADYKEYYSHTWERVKHITDPYTLYLKIIFYIY